MTNEHKYGIVYTVDGDIVGFNLPHDRFVPLMGKDIFEALEKKALEKQSNEQNTLQGVGNTLKMHDATAEELASVEEYIQRSHDAGNEFFNYDAPTAKADDCISRQELLDYLHFCITATENQKSHQLLGETYVKGTIDTLERVEIKVDMMDSVIPVRIRGKWIHWTDDICDYVRCSRCDYGDEGEVRLGEESSFCPSCGSGNREVSE